jgi:mono/diheme cytochrome c family protein
VSRLTTSLWVTFIWATFILLAGVASAAEPDGAKLYAERCSGCHGDQGGGDGPAAAALVPRPKNFHDLGGKSVDELRAIVKKGKPGTMMPPFDGVLSDTEIDAVVRHVQHFAAAPK